MHFVDIFPRIINESVSTYFQWVPLSVYYLDWMNFKRKHGTNWYQIFKWYIFTFFICSFTENSIGGVIISVLTVPRVWYIVGSSTDRVKPKTMHFVICSFSAKHAASRRKSKDWLARNQDNVSELFDMSILDYRFSKLALILV
jgi:hypothetical protein